VSDSDASRRLAAIAAEARAAAERGDGWAAGEAWRAYELVRDAARDPDELLAEGVALSALAVELAGQAERSEA
jgi:hypothetical protein